MICYVDVYRTLQIDNIMEPDRFQHNNKYYIVGIICLVGGLSLFAFSAYILPFLLFNWHYTMPDFISIWLNDIQTIYQLSAMAAAWLILLGFFLPGIILVVIADILSNRIDNQIHGLQHAKVRPKTTTNLDQAESRSLTFRIVLIIIIVFILARLFQWTISATLVP